MLQPAWQHWRARVHTRAADAAAADAAAALRAMSFADGYMTKRVMAAWRREALYAVSARRHRAVAAFTKASLAAALRRWIDFAHECGRAWQILLATSKHAV